MVVHLGGTRGWSWAPLPRQVMGLPGEGRCPSEEVKGRVLAFAQGPTWGLPARAPLPVVPTYPHTPRPGVETGSPSVSSCAQAEGAVPPPHSLGGRQQIPAHPSAFRWSRQEPPQSCLEGIPAFEEARAGGWGELHSKQSSWRLL